MSNQPVPTARLVLLGASNLTRSFAAAVGTAVAHLGAPLDIFAAIGHGRSYGIESRLLGRTLPGIVPCGLWNDLHRACTERPAPLYALITDIGNDIMYGVSPPSILDWIDTCLTRMHALDAQVIMTQLPMASLERIRPMQYQIVRRLFFPGRTISLNAALARARDIDVGLPALADMHGVTLMPIDRTWYGVDPIHVRQHLWPKVYRTLFEPWSANGDGVRYKPSLRRWWLLRTAPAETFRVFGMQCGVSQPCRRLADGSLVWMY